MQIRELEDKIYKPKPNEVVSNSAKNFIASFLKRKRSESLNETVSFQEVMDYLKQNKLVSYSKMEEKNKNDEELLTEFIRKRIDISEQDKSFINKKYRWKKIILGIYPQLDKDYYHYNMLGLAVTFGDANYVKTLIDQGVDVNLTTMGSMTPLMSASCNQSNFSKYNSCIKILLEAGADHEMQDNYGRTALDFSVIHGNEGAVRLLLQHGASISDEIIEQAEKNALLPYGPARNILNILTQAKQGIIKTTQPLMTEVIEKALAPTFNKDIANVIASYDTRSYGLRYFKMTRDQKIEPLFSEEAINKGRLLRKFK